MTKNKPKVVVAMSGGVDSSVAALLLKKQGYEVVGAFMKNWSDTKNDIGECSWKEERRMATKIASKLEIPLITMDFEKQYRKDVIDKMFEKYSKGITPNPDIDCNKKIKFPLFWKEAKKLGADYIATGHYARTRKKRGKTELLRAKDENKDQSYFLYQLSQKDLKNVLFPIGELTKNRVREIARKNKFPNFDKKSTVGICFVGKVNLKEFLQKRIKPKKGLILSPEGKVIGEHDGIFYYTIGQRLGPRFGITIDKTKFDDKQMKRWYVAKKDLKNNTITIAPEGHKINFRKEIWIKDFHLISEDKKVFKEKIKKKPKRLNSRIRQVGELLPGRLEFNRKENAYKVVLDKPITGVSEGQAIVLYEKEKCLGGGIIK